MELGEQLSDDGVWQLLNSGGAEAGYVFETKPMAPLPGFSGAPINLLVVLDLEGNFLNVHLVSHNEPIFVSGLGQAAFHEFFVQYRGHSITDSLVVGTPYGGWRGRQRAGLSRWRDQGDCLRCASPMKACLGATLKVAREKMSGIATGPPAYPDQSIVEDLTWDDLIAQGLVRNKRVSNRAVDAEFAGTLWEDDDPEAREDPDGTYLDLWIVDIGPHSVARSRAFPQQL